MKSAEEMRIQVATMEKENSSRQINATAFKILKDLNSMQTSANRFEFFFRNTRSAFTALGLRSDATARRLDLEPSFQGSAWLADPEDCAWFAQEVLGGAEIAMECQIRVPIILEALSFYVQQGSDSQGCPCVASGLDAEYWNNAKRSFSRVPSASEVRETVQLCKHHSSVRALSDDSRNQSAAGLVRAELDEMFEKLEDKGLSEAQRQGVVEDARSRIVAVLNASFAAGLDDLARFRKDLEVVSGLVKDMAQNGVAETFKTAIEDAKEQATQMIDDITFVTQQISSVILVSVVLLIFSLLAVVYIAVAITSRMLPLLRGYRIVSRVFARDLQLGRSALMVADLAVVPLCSAGAEVVFAEKWPDVLPPEYDDTIDELRSIALPTVQIGLLLLIFGYVSAGILFAWRSQRPDEVRFDSDRGRWVDAVVTTARAYCKSSIHVAILGLTTDLELRDITPIKEHVTAAEVNDLGGSAEVAMQVGTGVVDLARSVGVPSWLVTRTASLLGVPLPPEITADEPPDAVRSSGPLLALTEASHARAPPTADFEAAPALPQHLVDGVHWVPPPGGLSQSMASASDAEAPLGGSSMPDGGNVVEEVDVEHWLMGDDESETLNDMHRRQVEVFLDTGVWRGEMVVVSKQVVGLDGGRYLSPLQEYPGVSNNDTVYRWSTVCDDYAEVFFGHQGYLVRPWGRTDKNFHNILATVDVQLRHVPLLHAFAPMYPVMLAPEHLQEEMKDRFHVWFHSVDSKAVSFVFSKVAIIVSLIAAAAAAAEPRPAEGAGDDGFVGDIFATLKQTLHSVLGWFVAFGSSVLDSWQFDSAQLAEQAGESSVLSERTCEALVALAVPATVQFTAALATKGRFVVIDQLPLWWEKWRATRQDVLGVFRKVQAQALKSRKSVEAVANEMLAQEKTKDHPSCIKSYQAAKLLDDIEGRQTKLESQNAAKEFTFQNVGGFISGAQTMVCYGILQTGGASMFSVWVPWLLVAVTIGLAIGLFLNGVEEALRRFLRYIPPMLENLRERIESLVNNPRQVFSWCSYEQGVDVYQIEEDDTEEDPLLGTGEEVVVTTAQGPVFSARRNDRKSHAAEAMKVVQTSGQPNWKAYLDSHPPHVQLHALLGDGNLIARPYRMSNRMTVNEDLVCTFTPKVVRRQKAKVIAPELGISMRAHLNQRFVVCDYISSNSKLSGLELRGLHTCMEFGVKEFRTGTEFGKIRPRVRTSVSVGSVELVPSDEFPMLEDAPHCAAFCFKLPASFAKNPTESIRDTWVAEFAEWSRSLGASTQRVRTFTADYLGPAITAALWGVDETGNKVDHGRCMFRFVLAFEDLLSPDPGRRSVSGLPRDSPMYLVDLMVCPEDASGSSLWSKLVQFRERRSKREFFDRDEGMTVGMKFAGEKFEILTLCPLEATPDATPVERVEGDDWEKIHISVSDVSAVKIGSNKDGFGDLLVITTAHGHYLFEVHQRSAQLFFHRVVQGLRGEMVGTGIVGYSGPSRADLSLGVHLRDGSFGVQRWPDGSTYAGGWQNHQYHGYGELRQTGKTGRRQQGFVVYAGGWYLGVRHGPGTGLWTSPSGGRYRYTGMWANGLPLPGGEFSFFSDPEFLLSERHCIVHHSVTKGPNTAPIVRTDLAMLGAFEIYGVLADWAVTQPSRADGRRSEVKSPEEVYADFVALRDYRYRDMSVEQAMVEALRTRLGRRTQLVDSGQGALGIDGKSARDLYWLTWAQWDDVDEASRSVRQGFRAVAQHFWDRALETKVLKPPTHVDALQRVKDSNELLVEEFADLVHPGTRGEVENATPVGQSCGNAAVWTRDDPAKSLKETLELCFTRADWLVLGAAGAVCFQGTSDSWKITGDAFAIPLPDMQYQFTGRIESGRWTRSQDAVLTCKTKDKKDIPDTLVDAKKLYGPLVLESGPVSKAVSAFHKPHVDRPQLAPGAGRPLPSSEEYPNLLAPPATPALPAPRPGVRSG